MSYVFEKSAFELPLERCLMLDELQSYYFNKYEERCLVVIPTVSTPVENGILINLFTIFLFFALLSIIGGERFFILFLLPKMLTITV